MRYKRETRDGIWLIEERVSIGVDFSLQEILGPAHGDFRHCLGRLEDLLGDVRHCLTGFLLAYGTLQARCIPQSSPWKLRRRLQAINCDFDRLAEVSSDLGFPTVHQAIVSKAE